MTTQQEPTADGRGDFSADLERGAGPSILNNRHSTASGLSGIGSAISSSDSSIMGDPDAPPDAGEEWGPQHPCYPHLNPHVPVDSPEYANTRIIRIRRDWLLEGDLAPAFSNLYPEILDPAGVSESEFRRVVDKLNGELVPGFSPYHWRNVVDGVLGLATGWVWDDLGLTGIKSRLRGLERWIDEWNSNMAKTYGNAEEGAIPPRIVSLKRTGYMTVRIYSIFCRTMVGTNGGSSIYKSPIQKSRRRLRAPRVATGRSWRRRRRLVPLRELSTFTHCSDESSIRGQSDAFFSFDYIPTHTARQTCPRSFTLQRRGAYVCNILISRWLNGFFFFLDCGFLFHATAVQGGRGDGDGNGVLFAAIVHLE